MKNITKKNSREKYWALKYAVKSGVPKIEAGILKSLFQGFYFQKMITHTETDNKKNQHYSTGKM